MKELAQRMHLLSGPAPTRLDADQTKPEGLLYLYFDVPRASGPNLEVCGNKITARSSNFFLCSVKTRDKYFHVSKYDSIMQRSIIFPQFT